MRLRRVLIAAAFAAAVLPHVSLAAGVRIDVREEGVTHARELAGGGRIVAARPAPFRFNAVGVHWRGGGDVWFRTRAEGSGWSPWRPARPEGEDLPDRGSPERRPHAGWRVGNPYWTGPATRIQYRLEGNVSRLRGFFLWSPLERARRLTIAGTPGIIPRLSWGANESIVRAKPYYASDSAFAIVHHTAGRSPTTPEESAAIVRAIQAYHVQGNGWNDIGYNFLVDRFGQIFEGRGGGVDRPVVGAHAEGFNTGSVGIAVIGTYDSADIAAEARAALESLIAWRLDLAHVDPSTRVSRISAGNPRFPEGIPVSLNAVAGHRDTGFTSCPGNVLYGRLAQIAQAAAALGLPKLYEPRVSGSPGGAVSFTARLSEALPWTVTVTDQAGAPVAGGSGIGPDVAWTWDATAASPGVYAYRIDAGAAVLPVIGTIGTSGALDIRGLRAEPAVMTPTESGSIAGTTIAFSLSAPASVSATLLDAVGGQIAVLIPEQPLPAGPVSVFWDGVMPDGSQAPDGRYRIAVLARGATRDIYRSTEVVVDRSLGGLSLSSAVISPNGDGRLDALELAFDLARPAAVRVRIMTDDRSVARVFVGDLAGGARQVLSWNGRKRTGRVRDGSYAAVVEATTEHGTRTIVQPFAIDTTPPRVGILSARVRRGATKAVFTLSEPATVRIWYDRSAFTVDRPAGTVGFWQRLAARRVRIVARDAAGNVSERAVLRLPTPRG